MHFLRDPQGVRPPTRREFVAFSMLTAVFGGMACSGCQSAGTPGEAAAPPQFGVKLFQGARGEVRPGRRVRVVMHLTSTRRSKVKPNAMLHILSKEGNDLKQSEPVRCRWSRRGVWEVIFMFVVPPDAATGAYTLRVNYGVALDAEGNGGDYEDAQMLVR